MINKRYNAFTIAEILLSATLVMVLMALVAPNLNRVMPDEETIRFKKVYTGVITVVQDMLNDARVYPDFRGFADTSRGTDAAGDVYEGDTKFSEFFISKLNVLDDDVQVTAGEFPYGVVYETQFREVEYNVGDDVQEGVEEELVEGVQSADDFPCVKVNSGEIFCLPPRVSGVLNPTAPNSDNAVYIRIYLQDEDFSEQNAYYVTVRANGKVSLPTVGRNFNCKTADDGGRMRDAGFKQCQAVSKLSEIK